MLKKRFTSLFLALAMALSLSAPAWAEDIPTQTDANDKNVCYLQQCDEGYRLADSTRAYSAKSSNDVIAVELTDGGAVYQSADQRYFYQATDELFLEVGCVEIPATCEVSIEEIQVEYNLPDYVAEWVYDIIHSHDLTAPVKVYSSGLMAGRSTVKTYPGYNGLTYQDYISSFTPSTSESVEMFNSENESLASMKNKRIQIEAEYLANSAISAFDLGIFTLMQLNLDLSNAGIVNTYHTWTHSVAMRVEQTEKLTTVLIGNEYRYGARTSMATWDFVEFLDGGVGEKIDITYSPVFSAETPNYDNPSELCYKNYFYGGTAELLQNVKHGFVTFALR